MTFVILSTKGNDAVKSHERWYRYILRSKILRFFMGNGKIEVLRAYNWNCIELNGDLH